MIPSLGGRNWHFSLQLCIKPRWLNLLQIDTRYMGSCSSSLVQMTVSYSIWPSFLRKKHKGPRLVLLAAEVPVLWELPLWGLRKQGYFLTTTLLSLFHKHLRACLGTFVLKNMFFVFATGKSPQTKRRHQGVRELSEDYFLNGLGGWGQLVRDK